jgi:ABC-type multidrug transport system fused ATPase/permease subunit
LIWGGSIALITLAFLLSVLALPDVVNPSSTESVAYVFMIIYAFLAAILGFLVGLLIGWIIDLIFSDTRIIQSLKLMKLTVWLVLIAGLLSFTAFKYIDAKRERAKSNAKNTIGVKFNAGIIEKSQININDLKDYDLDLNKNHAIGYMESGLYQENQEEFVWDGKTYKIIKDDLDHVFIKNSDESVFVDYSLKGYPYVNTISYLVFTSSQGSYLFILNRLRATSSLSVLTVFAEDGTLVYEELMGRNNIIELGELNGEKVVIIANKDTKRDDIIVTVRDFIYRIRKN